MTMVNNKQIVKQLLDDISVWRIDGIMAALADDATWWLAGSIPGLSGTYNKSQMAELFAVMKATLLPQGLNITVDNMIGEGNFVAVEGHSETQLADGTPYANQYHWLFELRDGRVHRVREYLDTQLMKETSEAMVPGAG
jgi:hypothetical protein